MLSVKMELNPILRNWKQFPELKTKNIKQFLGLAGYYRRFISKH